MNFGNQERLIYRLKNAASKGQKISFLIGSGLTVKKGEGSLGVDSVKNIIDNISNIFIEDNSMHLLDQEMTRLGEHDIPARYQAAMRTLLECQGQEKLNEVIRNAVLNARINKSSLVLSGELDYETLEKDRDNWYINEATEALATLYQTNKQTFNNIILTSNFDPLIEISLCKKDITTQTLNINKDGRFDNIIDNGNIISVAHFHGYWRGSDTLHTIKQLTRPRPNLKASLKRLLKDSLLVIIGYGGWDDVFTSTLIEVINEDDTNLNVLWTFYSDDSSQITESHQSLFESIDQSLEQRVVLYNGIDCHRFFPTLLDNLNNDITSVRPPNAPVVKTIAHSEIFTSDNPVVNYKWVGRKNYLKSIDLDQYRVIYISGIGGQGKSGLASRYLEEYVNENSKWEFWDWRDCKEESNRIHSKIVSIIERITNGEYRASSFIGEKIEDIIGIFFKLIEERQIVFVFDNVDHYVDIENFKLIGIVGHLFREAIMRKHKCKFIFTGRPSISDIDSSFLILRLEGLDNAETQDLFLSHDLSLNVTDITNLSNTSFNLTKGHPLWLLLIIGQAFRGKDNVYSFIDEMNLSNSFKGNDESDILASNVLDTIWKRLTANQQLLLRIISETVRSETLDNLHKISSSEFKTVNKFNSSLNTLINLNLIVTKSYPKEKDEYDLHPLVKQFIRKKYLHSERSRFITLIVNYYNNILVVFKPKLDKQSPLYIFEKFTAKIELDVNGKNFQEALVTLHEITDSITSAGYVEEFIRVSHIVFINIDWEQAIIEEYAYFHDLFHNYVHSLTEFGKFDDASNFLNKYLKNIPGKSVNYIAYCKSMAYLYWFQENFEKAISIAEEGEALKRSSGIDTDIEISHNLALALRDTKRQRNIERALQIFKLGEPIEEIITQSAVKDDLGGTFYGNIGRCLFFMDQIDNALTCYKKSILLLKKHLHSNSHINLGYAYRWVGDILLLKSQQMEAIYCYSLAKHYWIKTSPIKATAMEKIIYSIIKTAPQLSNIDSLPKWELEKYCDNILGL